MKYLWIFSIKVRERKEQIKETAVVNPNAPPREIFMQSRQGLTDEQINLMPSYSASQRQIELQREIPGRLDVDKREIFEIVIQVGFYFN